MIPTWRERFKHLRVIGVVDSAMTLETLPFREVLASALAEIADLHAALATIENETTERCAIRGRIAQLKNKHVYDEIKALERRG